MRASLVTFLKLAAWAVGLGVIASQLARFSALPEGLFLVAASAVLLWCTVLAMDVLPHRQHSTPTVDPAPLPHQLQLD
jgi:hypothetical protein